MIPYFLLFGFGCVMLLTHSRINRRPYFRQDGSAWFLSATILLLMIGWRHQVGGDWFNYLKRIKENPYLSLGEALKDGEPAYAVLNWVGTNMFGGIYFVNFFCAAIFVIGLVAFCRVQPRPWLALVAAIPYLIIVVAMGYTRQSVAIGLAMLGMAGLERGTTWKFILYAVLATLFHRSAVILLPVIVFANTKNKILTLFSALVMVGTAYLLFNQDTSEAYTYGYLDAQMASSGAAIRVFMNLLPAIFFLASSRRMSIDPKTLPFWRSMAWGAVIFVVALYTVSSSTVVDRLALYWIPLQLFVVSRMPEALGGGQSGKATTMTTLALYHAAILTIWLNFAVNSYTWIPYRFYPFELLTN